MVRIPRSGSLFVFRKEIAPKIPRNPRKKIEITLSLYKTFGYLHCFFFSFSFFVAFRPQIVVFITTTIQTFGNIVAPIIFFNPL